MGGRTATVDLGRLLVKRQRIIGSVLRSRSSDEKARVMADVRTRTWPLVEAGSVRPVIDRVVPITEVEAAFDAVASDATFGKVVLTVP
jgi:NADPH:quinone reductase-like Zn-dependent oxidoreductase